QTWPCRTANIPLERFGPSVEGDPTAMIPAALGSGRWFKSRGRFGRVRKQRPPLPVRGSPGFVVVVAAAFPARDHKPGHAASASSKALACFTLSVSKPLVNQP